MSSLEEMPVSLEQRPNLRTYKPLFEAEALPRTATLTVWKTHSSKEADYKIWLIALDELEHTGAYSIKVRVDNNPSNFGIRISHG